MLKLFYIIKELIYYILLIIILFLIYNRYIYIKNVFDNLTKKQLLIIIAIIITFVSVIKGYIKYNKFHRRNIK